MPLISNYLKLITRDFSNLETDRSSCCIDLKIITTTKLRVSFKRRVVPRTSENLPGQNQIFFSFYVSRRPSSQRKVVRRIVRLFLDFASSCDAATLEQAHRPYASRPEQENDPASLIIDAPRSMHRACAHATRGCVRLSRFQKWLEGILLR